MWKGYLVRPLEGDDIFRAFALIRNLMPWLQQPEWIALVSDRHPDRDWLVAVDGEDYIHGLCHLFARRHPAHGLRLEVPIFFPLSLFDQPGVAEAMIAVIRRRGRECGCALAHFWPSRPENWQSLAALTDMTITATGRLLNLHDEGEATD